MNKINCINNTFVYKRYELQNKSSHEASAIEMYSKIIPGCTPEVLITDANLCVFNYIKDTGYKDKSRINSFVADVVMKAFNAYKKDKEAKLAWENILLNTTKGFIKYKYTLLSLNEEALFDSVSSGLRTILTCDSLCNNISFLHRDIHLGNILTTEDGYVLIDYEHAMPGPIELEFQNSIFWDDEMSIDVDIVKNLLLEKSIPYDNEAEKLLINFYIADQINICLKTGNSEKLNVIFDNSKKFIS